MRRRKIELEVSEDDDQVAYVRLSAFAETTKVTKSVRVQDLVGSYEGPEVVLDFDATGTLVGIEIVGYDDDEEEDVV